MTTNAFGYDLAEIRARVELYVAAYDANTIAMSAEHTSGGAPRQRDTWADPVDCVGLIPTPTLDAVMAYANSVGEDSVDLTARGCLEMYLEGQLANVCSDDTPESAIADVCVHVKPMAD